MGTPAVSPAQFSTFGDLLKYLRRQAELTQRELALQVGYSDTQVSRIEQNQHVPDAATLMALFVPALHLEREAEWTACLLELARAARLGKQPESETATEEGSIPKNNLPVQLTRFIGREHDISEVKKWLVNYRLVTLTGPGGCGKTRLALRIASDLRSAYEQGVWLVEFAPLNDPALITQAVAAVLGVREHPDTELSQTVFDYLSIHHTLLVFDNCEHLITDIARFVENILRICPNLSILVTSREGLGIPGEAIWGVPPLSLPIQQPWSDPAGAQVAINLYLQSESVQLFMARVSAVSPEFSLTIENGAWVAEICRRLDGMPLAIELAAARVRALSVKQIAERLDDRFNLLTAGSRTAPLRQQTLAAALDWSYALLGEQERRVLQRLSVFVGGVTLESAEAICSCESVKREEVLDVLSHLVDKSLVVADHSSSETRYRLLETIRQYARQKLNRTGG